MRRLLGPKLKPLVFGIILALAIATVPAGKALAACSDLSPCKPYFKAFGSDVFAGGWFIDTGTCDTSSSSSYQDAQTPLSGGLAGGILAYTSPPGSASVGGASSQYGGFALGGIEGDPATFRGFYSNGANSATVSGPSTLTFANDNNLPWGGNFQGDIRQSHCIPDYFSKKPLSGVTTIDTDGLQNNMLSGIYGASPPSGTIFRLDGSEGGANTTITIELDRDITIYVDGPVYIRNNIVYRSGFTESNVPKLTLVAKGSIYIDYRVTQLDGLYIAQPRNTSTPVTDDTGIIWTCHGNNTDALTSSWLLSNCGSRLVFNNAALIAKQIHFTRIPGHVAFACKQEDVLSNALACSNIAEIINYSPAMVIGGEFFNPSNTAPLDIESLVSLPPTL
jgi:hypothetical protein